MHNEYVREGEFFFFIKGTGGGGGVAIFILQDIVYLLHNDLVRSP